MKEYRIVYAWTGDEEKGACNLTVFGSGWAAWAYF